MCGKLVSSSSQITPNSQNNTNTSSNSKVVQPIATSETFNPPKSTNECNYSHEEMMKFEERKIVDINGNNQDYLLVSKLTMITEMVNNLNNDVVNLKDNNKMDSKIKII